MDKRAEKLKKFCDDILSMNNKEGELIKSINGSLIKIANHKNIIEKQLLPLSGNLRAKNDLDTSLRINDVIVTIKTLIESNSSKIINWRNEFVEISKKNVALQDELIIFLEKEYSSLGTINLKKTLDKTKAREKIEKNLYRLINAITNANNLKELESYLNNVVCARIDKIVNVNKEFMENESEYLRAYINFKVNSETKIDFFKLESDLLILSQQISEQIELERSSYISSFGIHTKNKDGRLKVIKGFLTTGFIDKFKSKYIITKKDVKSDIKKINSSLIKEYGEIITQLTVLGFCKEFPLKGEDNREREEIIVVDEDEVDEFARKIASA